MRTSSMLGLGAALLCCLLISQAHSQDCKCDTLIPAKCNPDQTCTCTIQMGTEIKEVNCSKLIPKCWLMKRESLPGKDGRRRPRPQNALVDNDGLYNPDCENDGTFKARQCNGTETCWCVNSAGIRRTDKGDKASKTCPKLVRTQWVIIELKRNNDDQVSAQDVDAAVKNLLTTRYKLPAQYIVKTEIEGPYIYINLTQTSGHKKASPSDVDIADVAYYLEKDLKGDNFLNPDNKFQIRVNGKDFPVQEPLVMFVDEEPHEISMKHLTPGVIAVIVVVVVAIVAGIVVLVLTRRKRGSYEKAEMKEMNEMHKELNT